jgi:hypothetical protein
MERGRLGLVVLVVVACERARAALGVSLSFERFAFSFDINCFSISHVLCNSNMVL